MKFQLPAFEKANVLVVGDTMLDKYWYGNTDRISPEAPVPVVHVNHESQRPGGAGNVALNIAALGASTKLVGMVGKDEAAELLKEKLSSFKINCYFKYEENKPTIMKLRVLSHNQQLIRMDFEEQFYQFSEASPLLELCEQHFLNTDVMIMSDYGKGSMGNRNKLIEAAKKHRIPVLVDPKGRDFSIYNGATLLTPNFKEFEAVVGPCVNEADIIEKGFNLIQRHSLEALLITRGAKGMTLLRVGEPNLHLPAKSQEVFDVTGAGDTVIAMVATALAAGADLSMAVALSNLAASITVAKLGAGTVSVPELRRAILQESDTTRGVMTKDQLITIIEDAKDHGEVVVMVCGCYDVIQVEDVEYLEQAKRLGHRLIVAVPDDDAIKSQGFSQQLINPVERRMAAISGLAAVDWVIPFSEESALNVVKAIRPHVLLQEGESFKIDISGIEVRSLYRQNKTKNEFTNKEVQA